MGWENSGRIGSLYVQDGRQESLEGKRGVGWSLVVLMPCKHFYIDPILIDMYSRQMTSHPSVMTLAKLLLHTHSRPSSRLSHG